MAANIARSAAYYRTNSQPHAQAARPSTYDDYEPWFTQPGAWNNRMVLSLRSRIPKEVEWSLDRLTRFCHNHHDQFLLRKYPGLLDALFECPRVYLERAALAMEAKKSTVIFAESSDDKRTIRHGNTALFILRNASVLELNANELAQHPQTLALVQDALKLLDPDEDTETEFLVNAIELLHAVGALMYFSSSPNILLPIIERLEYHASSSHDRSLIIGSFSALTALMRNLRNLPWFRAESGALETAIRFTALLVDSPLISACLEYIYTRLSHPPLLRAFLKHRLLNNTLRILFSVILSKQKEEEVAVDMNAANVPNTVSQTVAGELFEMSQEELAKMATVSEPQRSYEWLRTMFVHSYNQEVTQVDFWNLYKDAFSSFNSKQPMLPAAEVIKNVTVVFPQAQAMVLPGPPQRFVIRGIGRRNLRAEDNRYRCQWGRSTCSSEGHPGPQELYEHLLEHAASSNLRGCNWAQCTFKAEEQARLRTHVLTHIPSHDFLGEDRPGVDETQSNTNGLVPVDTKIRYRRAVEDPDSNALTALLIVRLIFRISASTTDAVPRADADHFGFPGIQEEMEEEEEAIVDAEIQEGERRGRRAITRVRHQMEQVQMRDPALQEWITEMIQSCSVQY